MEDLEQDERTTRRGLQEGSTPAEELAELGAEPGLCGHCRHLRLVRSRRSTFARCGLADHDPRFPRYPALPVVRCGGYTPLSDSAAPVSGQGSAPERSHHG